MNNKIDDIVKTFGNELAMHLTPSNESMKAVRFAREALTEILHQQLQKAREEALEREKQLKQVHMMELDAISCMSLEQYVAWRDYRKQRPHHSELDQDTELLNSVKEDWDKQAKNAMNGLDQDVSK